jgi:cytochrome P450
MIHQPTVVPVEMKESAKREIILPADCRVYLNVPATQYSPINWTNPRKLDPNRWITNAGEQDDNWRKVSGRLIGFSDGARACLGRKFAQAEILAFLATALRHHRVALRKDMDRERVERDLYTTSAGLLTLSPLDYIKVELQPRH